MRILFIGDIVGSGGREAVNRFVPELRREYGCDFCIANGENMANGNGFARSTLNELKRSKVDVFTGGDHTWDQKEFEKEILDFPNVIRPANVSPLQPGKGMAFLRQRTEPRWASSIYLDAPSCGSLPTAPLQLRKRS